ncbi:MAG: acetylornithine deacetylase [Pseudomonadales bacterium]
MASTPSFRHALTSLIGASSVSSTSARHDQGNMEVIHLLANWLNELGFECEILPLDGQSHKANLIATLGQGSGGLVLSGHTDTVPYDDKGWQSDPLILTERDQRLYGLGSCDMKGFFAVVLEAIQGYKASDLKQPLIILATADEESSMAGAQALLASGRQLGRYALIGEPTGLVPVYKHKSIMMQSIQVSGQAGHSSNPLLGNSALEIMHDVIGELLNYRQQLQLSHQDTDFAVAYPTLNLGCIHGGDNPNRICSHCELHFDARLLPSMDNSTVTAEIEQLLGPIAQRHGAIIELSPLIDGVAPFAQDGGELITACERLTGNQAQAVNFATEAPFLQAMGMETLVLGPGSIDQAHQPDEFLPMDNIQPMVKIIRQLIAQFCQ